MDDHHWSNHLGNAFARATTLSEFERDCRKLIPVWPGDELDINDPRDLAIRCKLAIQQERRRVVQRHWIADALRLRALVTLRDIIESKGE